MKVNKIIPVGNIFYGKYRYGFAGNVVNINGICATITTNSGGYREPLFQVIYER